MTVIVKTISRLIFPFIFLFGVYVIIHGHLTPGGGFPGGVIIAASIAMFVMAYGLKEVQERIMPLHAEVLDTIGSIGLAMVGLIGILAGTSFLQNVFSVGQVGELFSAGNLPILYIFVGIKVTAGILLIFFAMMLAFWGEMHEH